MFTAIAGFGVSSMAQETSAPKDKVAEITKTEKKSRNKKVEMCSECGKPESECECHGKKEGGDSKKEHTGH